MSTIILGQPIPDFSLTSTHHETTQISEFHGKNLILFFYPKDDTPGCTIEAQEFRNLYPQFQKLTTEVIGISRDSLKSHEKFICKYQLPFPLISDHDSSICNLFSVIKPKNMYGKMVNSVERSTFLINKNGILQQEWRKVVADGHAANVLTFLKEHHEQNDTNHRSN